MLSKTLGQVLADIKSASRSTKIGASTKKQTLTNGSLSWSGVSLPPQQLIASSGLSADIYSCARCVASEANPSDEPEIYLAIAEGIRNEARRKGYPIYNLIARRTTKAYAFTQDQYGEQHGRWASSSQDPNAKSLAAAHGAIVHGTDLGKGVVRWLDPGPFKSGKQGTRKLRPLDEIVSSWQSEGFRLIQDTGIPPSVLLLFTIGPRVPINSGPIPTEVVQRAVDDGFWTPWGTF